MDKNEEQALNDIEVFGCHILHVLGDDQCPKFSYSIGIQRKTSFPELVVTGLKFEVSEWIINEYNRRIKSGESFHENSFYDGFLENFPVEFKLVKTNHYKEYFGWALWYYKKESFNVYQLIYPSVSGIWPWSKNSNEHLNWNFPKLYEI